MILQRLFTCFILICLLFSAASVSVYADELKAGVQYDESYLLGPGDAVSVTVTQAVEFSAVRLLVPTDGKISFPGVGEIDVLNKSIHQVEGELTASLKQYIHEPSVSLSLVETKPGIVYFSGAVQKPGMHEFSTTAASEEGRSQMRLVNAIARAGGVKLNADLSNVKIERGNGDEPVNVNLWDMLYKSTSESDIWLRNGDKIIIPELSRFSLTDEQFQLLLSSPIGPKSFPVRVSGFANTPGLYELDGLSPYLQSAISKAGGMDPVAKQQEVHILRMTDQNRLATITINPQIEDVMLRPNDIVVVSEMGFEKVARRARAVSNILSPVSNILGFGLAGTFIKNNIDNNSN